MTFDGDVALDWHSRERWDSDYDSQKYFLADYLEGEKEVSHGAETENAPAYRKLLISACLVQLRGLMTVFHEASVLWSEMVHVVKFRHGSIVSLSVNGADRGSGSIPSSVSDDLYLAMDSGL